MHSKKSLIRVLTRILYGGGFVFLITGLLLSALSSSVLAAGTLPLDLSQAVNSTNTPTKTGSGTPCDCITPTPYGTKPAPTRTRPPGTIVPTHTPMDFNLSAICGYPSDNYELWKVANNTGDDANFVWKVVGSSESGSGSVKAHGYTYFKSSPGLKTVRLYVDNQMVDQDACLGPCKKELQLSYTCTAEGLTWHVNNANIFGVDYVVKVDNKEVGKGMAPANSTIDIAKTTSGVHTVQVTWTDTRPGTHTVTLSSPVNSCSTVITETPTPTMTLTPPNGVITITPTPTETRTPEIITITPTPTETRTPEIVTITPTPTQTMTPPLGEITITPTPTETRTPEIVTITPTPTQTMTPPLGMITITPTPTATQTTEITITLTPTMTLTPPFGVITITPTVTQTPQLSVVTVTGTPTETLTPAAGFLFTPTSTQIVTLAPPVITTTSTPVLIPVTGADMTRPIGGNTLSLFGGLLTNVGLFTLGLALALTGITSQMKE